MRQLVFLGDIHGSYEVLKGPGFKDTDIYQVGDFGLGFKQLDMDVRSLHSLNNYMDRQNNHLYVIRGNHDNPEFFKEGEFKDFATKDLTNIHLLDDYTVVNLQGKNILGVGGAISIDRTARIEGRDYWKGERFDFDPIKIDIFSRIDIVVTHTAPLGIYPFIMGQIVKDYYNDDPTLQLDLMYERDNVKRLKDFISWPIDKWFYGHFHESHQERVEGTDFKLLAINEYYEYENRD